VSSPCVWHVPWISTRSVNKFKNVCKFNECFDCHEILFGILIWNVYNYNFFINVWYRRNNHPLNIKYLIILCLFYCKKAGMNMGTSIPVIRWGWDETKVWYENEDEFFNENRYVQWRNFFVTKGSHDSPMVFNFNFYIYLYIFFKFKFIYCFY